MTTEETITACANCAACGKEGGNLNTCNKCKMVKYCNAACKKKHRSRHKKACERRVAELHDEELFKDHPPNDDCPICFLPLPLYATESTFHACCGKRVCNGCIYAMIGEARGRGKIELCAFCRVPNPSSEGKHIKRTKKLMDANNAHAFYNLAGFYANGSMGMPQDFAKANELYLMAGELGCSEGYFNLGNSYKNGEGVEVDKKKAKHYWELAAINGNVNARHNLGVVEGRTGNYHRGMKHCIIAAKAGEEKSLDVVKAGFMDGMIAKDEYANTLRAHQERCNEMKSDQRDKAEEFYRHLGNGPT